MLKTKGTRWLIFLTSEGMKVRELSSAYRVLIFLSNPRLAGRSGKSLALTFNSDKDDNLQNETKKQLMPQK